MTIHSRRKSGSSSSMALFSIKQKILHTVLGCWGKALAAGIPRGVRGPGLPHAGHNWCHHWPKLSPWVKMKVALWKCHLKSVKTLCKGMWDRRRRGRYMWETALSKLRPQRGRNRRRSTRHQSRGFLHTAEKISEVRPTAAHGRPCRKWLWTKENCCCPQLFFFLQELWPMGDPRCSWKTAPHWKAAKWNRWKVWREKKL